MAVKLIIGVILFGTYMALQGEAVHAADRIKATPKDNTLPSSWGFPRVGGEAGTESYYPDADSPMCQELQEYMNKVGKIWIRSPEGFIENYCTDGAKNAPFFFEPDWKELSPSEHLSLIAKLLRYEYEGIDYFKKKKSRPLRNEKYYLDSAREFIKSGGRLQYWKTDAVQNYKINPLVGSSGKYEKEIQHIIQLRYKNDARKKYEIEVGKNYKDCPLSGWIGKIFVVNEELTSPISVSEYAMHGGSLLLYKGEPVLFTTDWRNIEINSISSEDTINYCTLIPYYKESKQKP